MLTTSTAGHRKDLAFSKFLTCNQIRDNHMVNYPPCGSTFPCKLLNFATPNQPQIAFYSFPVNEREVLFQEQMEGYLHSRARTGMPLSTNSVTTLFPTPPVASATRTISFTGADDSSAEPEPVTFAMMYPTS